MKKLLASIYICIFMVSSAWSQRDSLPNNNPNLDINFDLIEDFVSNQEEESDFDWNAMFEILEYYYDKPLNLNKATEEDLFELNLLTSSQINDLINYRATAGDLLAIYELQAIPSFDLATIQRILPFVKIKAGLDDYNVPIWEMMYKGKNTVYLRWDRTLEKKKGYIEDENGETKYLGDANRYYIRYRHQYENRLSYGFTLEKDAGEELFKGSNKGFPGFDFATAHFFLKDINKTFKGIAVGDFAVNMGQGLIMFDGFGSGKGSFVNNIRKSGNPLRSYTSVGEVLFKRGAGLHVGIGKNFEVMAFGSYRGRDANISVTNEDEEDLDILEISSIQTSGLHRTLNEIEDKNAIQHLSTGGTLKYRGKRWHIAANGLLDKLDVPLLRNTQLYNQYSFNGDRLINGSIDYSFILKNFNFFGEVAMSDNGGKAAFNGVIIGLDKKAIMSVAHRYYEKEYQALFSNSFAETSNTNNESGLYLGLELFLNKNWSINSYFDTWRHPWLRSGVDAPSQGSEYFTRVTYKIKRKLQLYGQFRHENKEKNARDNETKTDYLVDTKRTNIRLHFEYNLSKAFTLRSRSEMVIYDDGLNNTPTNYGYLLLQDLIYKPMGFPLSFTSRFAIFDTDNYDSRLYAYENDILLSFSIPAYYNRGTRFYLNLRYRGIKNTTLEFRFAQTYYSNLDTFGSGNELIDKPHRSDIRFQIKYQFGKY